MIKIPLPDLVVAVLFSIALC